MVNSFKRKGSVTSLFIGSRMPARPEAAAPASGGPPGYSRNVSFTKDSEESTAYREHNPPTILRQQEARRPRPENSDVAKPSLQTSQELRTRSKSPSLSKDDELHILLAVTGSVATIKIPLIIHKLKQIYRRRAAIQLVVTRASTAFFDPSELPKDVKVWFDSDEWRSRTGIIDNTLHIQLRRWADVLLVAPCSANTLAKFCYGICDNLLTSLFRVWNSAVPILLAPAMNTHMYTNPVTKRHLQYMKDHFPSVLILKPVEKVLVCGDIGMGGMREWTDIVQILVRQLGVLPEHDADDEEMDDEEDE